MDGCKSDKCSSMICIDIDYLNYQGASVYIDLYRSFRNRLRKIVIFF